MRFTLIILFYAIIGSSVFTWALSIDAISPFICFALFISYAVLVGLLFRRFSDRGFLI